MDDGREDCYRISMRIRYVVLRTLPNSWTEAVGYVFQHLHELFEKGCAVVPGTGTDQVVIHDAIVIDIFATESPANAKI
jgi:hypothetical protein